MNNAAGDALLRRVHQNLRSFHGRGGCSRRRPDLKYKFCCGDHMFPFPAHRPISSETLLTSLLVSSTCILLLFHLEILVFFSFFFISLQSRVENVINTPTHSQGIEQRISCCVLTSDHSDILQGFCLRGNSRERFSHSNICVLSPCGDYQEFSACLKAG